MLNASYYFFELRRNWCGTGIASATPVFAPNLIIVRPGRLALTVRACHTTLGKSHTWYAYLPACDVPIISHHLDTLRQYERNA